LDTERNDNLREVLAFIPARRGSKGISNKNVADLGGIPLLAHSIMAARHCPLITRTLVSTDSALIAETAREWGAEVPFLRPVGLAEDRSLIGHAVKHLLNTLEKRERYVPRCLVILFPTNPFRSSETMRFLVGKLLEGYKNVVTLKKVVIGPLTHFVRGNDGLVSLHGGRPPLPTYRRYGLFTGYWHRGTECCGVYSHLLTEPAELIDIDTPADLARANEILDSGVFVPEWLT